LRRLYTQHFFKHETRGRHDEGINTLEGLGYRNAYRHWFSLLEIAVEEGAQKKDGTFKINERKLAQELRIKLKKVPEIMEIYQQHLSFVCHRSCTRVPHVCSTYRARVQHVWIITISNLLARTENRGKKGIYKDKRREDIFNVKKEEEEKKQDELSIDKIYKTEKTEKLKKEEIGC